MKLCRFATLQGPQWGSVEEREGAMWVTRIVTSPQEDSVQPYTGIFEPIPLSAVTLLAPVVPSKIVCVGRNYADHAKEMGGEVPTEPLLFLKPPSALLAPEGFIEAPAVSRRVDFEGELGVVIGKRARDLAEDAEVSGYIRGYVCVNDVTARDLQQTDGQWSRAKGFDTFCPVGPWLVDEASFDISGGVAVTTRLNGEVKQNGTTNDLFFGVPHLVRYISRIFTLEPGDLICTGTPAGVGPMVAGDVVEVEIGGLGVLRNTVKVRA